MTLSASTERSAVHSNVVALPDKGKEEEEEPQRTGPSASSGVTIPYPCCPKRRLSFSRVRMDALLTNAPIVESMLCSTTTVLHQNPEKSVEEPRSAPAQLRDNIFRTIRAI